MNKMAIVGGFVSACIGYLAFKASGLAEACSSPVMSIVLGIAFVALCLLSYTGGRTAAN